MRKLFVILLLMITSILLTGCQLPMVDVMTTSFFNYDIVKNLVVNTPITYNIIVEPGTHTEHTITEALTAAKLQQLKKARLLVYTSLTLNQSLLSRENNLPSERLNIFKAIMPLEDDPIAHYNMHSHTHEDNEHMHRHALIHYWTSIANIISAANAVSIKLQALFPDQAPIIALNTTNYNTKLQTLKQEFHTFITKHKPKEIIYLGHDAIGAFMDEFKLPYHPLQISLDDAKKANSKAITNLVAELQEENIDVVFVPELEQGKDIFNTLKQKLPQLVSYQISAIHNISRHEFKQGISYYQIMVQNITNIKKYLMA